MNRLVGFVLALVVLGGVIYFVAPYLRTAQTQVSVRLPTDAEVTIAAVREESDTYVIDVKYPQFGLPADLPARGAQAGVSAQAEILAIDADIKSKIDASVVEFKALPPNPPESLAGQAATPQNEFTGSFENVYVGPDVVSAKLVLSQYTGGAHPMTIFSGLNYDRATGQQLLQNDAFEMIGLTVDEVSARAIAELKARLGDTIFEEGANTNPENFSSFIISADKVTFIFQPYQVAAYAAGVQEVSFERKK